MCSRQCISNSLGFYIGITNWILIFSSKSLSVALNNNALATISSQMTRAGFFFLNSLGFSQVNVIILLSTLIHDRASNIYSYTLQPQILILSGEVGYFNLNAFCLPAVGSLFKDSLYWPRTLSKNQIDCLFLSSGSIAYVVLDNFPVLSKRHCRT
jgi:hypothetical protein